VLSAATELTPHTGRVILISGNVASVGTGSITVNGVTCAFTRTAKPLPGAPTWAKDVSVGDTVLLACTSLNGRLVATGLTER
jgi:hypothetical protein